MIDPPSNLDTKHFLTGNVNPLGIFCKFGEDEDSLPVEVMVWLRLVCRILLCLNLLIPFTNVDRYVLIADSSMKSSMKDLTKSFLAVSLNFNKVVLLARNPAADVSMALMGESLSPAVTVVGISMTPEPPHLEHLGGVLYGIPFAVNFSMLPIPLQTVQVFTVGIFKIVVLVLTNLLNCDGFNRGGFKDLPRESDPMLNSSFQLRLSTTLRE